MAAATPAPPTHPFPIRSIRLRRKVLSPMRLRSIGFLAPGLIIALAGVAGLASAQPRPAPAVVSQPTIAVPADVESLLRDYERAWLARDTAALARLFTPNGVALPNGDLPAQGNDAIAAAYAKAAGSPLRLRPIAFGQSQDLGYVVGAFGPAAGEPEFGKFVLVLQRSEDGSRWRIVADMDNMNGRPARPASAAATPVKP
ncbi:YybH family protein [Piscinibacter sakaiensis]|uniref:YybH family protein n=1 Tax=Piscinibacter sakaiensis TaxID=1547922 RepID=UPI003AAE355A